MIAYVALLIFGGALFAAEPQDLAKPPSDIKQPEISAGVQNTSTELFFANNAEKLDVSETGSGLQYKTLMAATGPSPAATDIVLIKYTGKLLDGTIFDTSDNSPSKQVVFQANQLVPGFSEGLLLMQKKSKFRFWIPAALAYGNSSPTPKVPANSALIFDVELVDFISPEQLRIYQQQALEDAVKRAAQKQEPK